jgi:hypothetical protein
MKDPVKKAWDSRARRDYVVVSVAGIDTLRQGFMTSAVAGTAIGHGTGENWSLLAYRFYGGRS